jgi:hypothetical protein
LGLSQGVLLLEDELLDDVLLEVEELDDEHGGKLLGFWPFPFQQPWVGAWLDGSSADGAALALPTTLSAMASTRQPVPR